MKKVLEEEKITWRSFWCGKEGTGGAIPTEWNVRGWPTLYVVDPKGVIRHKWLGAPGTRRWTRPSTSYRVAEKAEKDAAGPKEVTVPHTFLGKGAGGPVRASGIRPLPNPRPLPRRGATGFSLDR